MVRQTSRVTGLALRIEGAEQICVAWLRVSWYDEEDGGFMLGVSKGLAWATAVRRETGGPFVPG